MLKSGGSLEARLVESLSIYTMYKEAIKKRTPPPYQHNEKLSQCCPIMERVHNTVTQLSYLLYWNQTEGRIPTSVDVIQMSNIIIYSYTWIGLCGRSYHQLQSLAKSTHWILFPSWQLLSKSMTDKCIIVAIFWMSATHRLCQPPFWVPLCIFDGEIEMKDRIVKLIVHDPMRLWMEALKEG